MSDSEVELPLGMTQADAQRILEAAAKKQSKSSSEDYVEFGCWEAGKEQMRVYRSVYKGKEGLHIRRWYNDPIEGWKPGKGVWFTEEDVPLIQEALEKMDEWLTDNNASGVKQFDQEND